MTRYFIIATFFTLLLFGNCTRETTEYQTIIRNDTITDTIVRVDTVIQEVFPDTGVVIFLVRHAETAGGGNNPHLSAQGMLTAGRLKESLKNNPLSAVYATLYFRTEETAAAVSQEFGLTTTSYDATDLTAFSQMLLAMHKGERILVVGHSNTTPELINILAGTNYGNINDTVYNKFFIVNKNQIETLVTELNY